MDGAQLRADFGAVTLRIYLPISQVVGIDFDIAYPVIAWIAWVPTCWSPSGRSTPLRETRCVAFERQAQRVRQVADVR